MEQIEHIEELHEIILMHLREITMNNKDFRFSIRKSDKENRLSKGYYFYGNEGYLALSFWSGTDWKNKTPNIIIVFLPEEETVYLEISVSDSIEKMEFVKKYLLDSELGLEPKNGKFYKPLNGNSYISILDSFISNEKKVIDKIVNQHQTFFKEIDLENRIGFIDEDLFNLRLSKALQFRQNRLLRKVDSYPPRLSELRIKDFCGIQNLEILNLANNSQWIFFTGINGSGKSSILKAITLALCPNTKEHRDFEEPGHFKISLQLFRGDNKINVLSTAEKLPSENFYLSKGFAAYGPSRLMMSDFSTRQSISSKELKRRQSASYSIFHSDGILLDFATEIESLTKGSKDLKVREKLSIIIETLVECIDSLANIFVNLDETNSVEALFVEKDENNRQFIPVKYFQVSSGTKSLIAMIGDMMIRLFREQPDIYDVGELKGIVLIDEIDIHFHPKQQRNLVEALTNSFPKVQFIVTTHSPIPFLGAPENSIFIQVKRSVEKGVQVEKLDLDVKNLLPNTILSSPIFDFINITSINHKKGEEKVNTEALFEDVIANQKQREKLKEIAKRLEDSDDL